MIKQAAIKTAPIYFDQAWDDGHVWLEIRPGIYSDGYASMLLPPNCPESGCRKQYCEYRYVKVDDVDAPTSAARFNRLTKAKGFAITVAELRETVAAIRAKLAQPDLTLLNLDTVGETIH